MLNASSTGSRRRDQRRSMDAQALSELAVVIPNLHWRFSGVTASNRAVAPAIGRHLRTAWLGSHPPQDVVRLSAGELFRLRTGEQRLKSRIWHARRNDEMVVGVLLKLLGWPFKLVFTSAGQRRHSWITRFLIARMDAVIATSDASASYLQRAATVVLHGVDADVYRPPADRARLCRERIARQICHWLLRAGP
jgi:mannosyltransferase